MSAEKFSASMDDALLAEARAEADREGVSFSSWLAEAAADRLRLEALRREIALYEEEHGTITDAEIEAVRSEIDASDERIAS